jgi:LuxR family transcriptional regulator, quorum-sensing system regulator BjaR1
MRDYSNIIFEATERMNASNNLNELRKTIEILINKLGFHHVTCATVRSFQGAYLHESNFQTWPEAEVAKFAKSGLFRHDPVIARSRQEFEAFFWTNSIYDRSNPHHREILSIREGCGVTGGCCVPVIERVGGQPGGRVVLYVTGNDFDNSRECRLALQLIAAQIALRLANLKSEINLNEEEVVYYESTGLLTARERSILSWVAAGKSSWEIAQILSISEHTVNTHIEKAFVKLHASNRTEAVVKAIILDELRLNHD